MGTMSEESNLEEFQNLAESYELIFHDDYSGRGMFGRQCIGVEGTHEQFWKFTLAIAMELRVEVVELLDPPRTDSMGHNTIWYWPGLTVESIG